MASVIHWLGAYSYRRAEQRRSSGFPSNGTPSAISRTTEPGHHPAVGVTRSARAAHGVQSIGHSSRGTDAARRSARAVNTTTHERHAGVHLTLICDPCRGQTQRAEAFVRRFDPCSDQRLAREAPRSRGGVVAEVLQASGLVGLDERLDEAIKVTFEQAGQVVDGQAHSVIGHAVIGEVVGPNLL